MQEKNFNFFDIEAFFKNDEKFLPEQDSYPEAIFFSPNGIKIFLLGLSHNQIYSYTLKTPWNLDTISYDNICFHTGKQTRRSKQFFFSENGTRMFVLGNNNTIYSYDLENSWNISKVNYNNEKFVVGSQDRYTVGFFLSSNGKKLFTIGQYNCRIYSYTLNDSWNISSAVYDEKSLYVGEVIFPFPKGFFFNSEGTKMFMFGSSYNKIFSYTLSVPWDISTAKYDNSCFHTNTNLNPNSLFFTPNGKKMYILDWKTRFILSFSLKNAYEFSTALVKKHTMKIDIPKISKGMIFNSNGTKMLISGDNDRVHRYTLETPWEISTLKYDNVSFDIPRRNIEKIDPKSIFFSSNGKKLYIAENSSNTIYSFSLRKPWNIATASYDFEFLDVSSVDTNLKGIFFRSDGRKLFIVGKAHDSVYSYTLSNPWDIMTAVYDHSSFSIYCYAECYAEDPGGIFFNSQGTVMYVLGKRCSMIYSFDLACSWNISTAIFKRSFPIHNTDSLEAMYFDETGKSMHVLNRNMYSRYELLVPWNISTASLRYVRPIEGTSMFLQNDGKKLFILKGNTLSSYLLEK